jgi:hypothetical protein
MIISDYNGIPFSYTRYNCIHHVARVRRAAGLSTPHVVTPTDRADVNRTIELSKMSGQFAQVEEPQDFDIVVIPDAFGHVGVYVGGMVSHCSAAERCVVLDSVAEFIGLEFYRVV